MTKDFTVRSVEVLSATEDRISLTEVQVDGQPYMGQGLYWTVAAGTYALRQTVAVSIAATLV